LKRLTHTGSTLRARAVADKAAIAQAVEKNVLPLLASGRVKPLIDSTFPLAQASAAHTRMESGKHIGKNCTDPLKLNENIPCSKTP
ncbi:MAG TPA: zinc-binding dehydrogenase, partial [Xanthobacteraceae bacterium]